MSRETFLSRVREAARAGNTYRVHVEAVPDDVGYCGAGDDPAGRLAAEVNAVGGEGVVVGDRGAARAALADLLRRYAPSSALCWRHPLLDELGLAELLTAGGVERIDYETLGDREPGQQREQLLAADIGISSVTLAVAETGTLALASEPGRERAVSLLPPVHVAVVGASQIVPDLFDLFAIIERSLPEMPSNWVLITGPSKTGDLELKLTTGVHGPGHWHVIVAREL